MSKKIMLVDGNSIINRAFYGVPLLSNSEGIYTNGVYGFLNILFKLLEEDQPDYIAVAFDLKAPTFRHEVFQEYKGNRKGMPEELKPQIPLLKDILDAMGIKRLEKEGYEADDILGTVAKRAEEQGMQPIIVSGDRDLLQLATEQIKIRIPKTKKGGTEIEDYYAKDLIEKIGVTPLEYIDVKALMGDSSDNIPGVPGIGEKTAIKIIQQYHNIENAIAHADEIKPSRASENLKTYQEQARQSKFLATICTQVPIEFDWEQFKLDSIMNPRVCEIFKQLEFKSFLDRFSMLQETNSVSMNTHLSEVLYRAVDSKEAFEKVVEEIFEAGKFSFIIFSENHKPIGISFCYADTKGVWVGSSDEFSIEEIMALAKPLFESIETEKIAHHAKNAMHILKHFGITLRNLVFDTMIGGYVLNPTKETYEYDDLAQEFLGQTFPSEEEILGKGKSKKSIMNLEEKDRTSFTAGQAYIIYHAEKQIKQKLKENNQEQLYYEIEHPLIEVLFSMEEYGFKIDTQRLKEYVDELEEKIELLTKEIYEIAGEEFNINSPKQLGVILFEKLMLPMGKKTKTGYSTAAEVLEKLRAEHIIIEKILEYRQLVKLKTTYGDGLFAVVNQETQKIHSTFNQTITATGRISSTEPNLQNIPIKLEMGRKIRKVFIPSDEEYLLLDADYSQIELRVLAHIAKDETLIRAFRTGEDIHKLTASQVFKVPLDEVTPRQRSNAKAVNFGIVYGIGAFSLSQDLNISRKEAEAYIEGYFEKYPNVRKYMDETIKQARELGYVTTLFGRRRVIPDINSTNFARRSFGERVAMNTPIQGTAADIIKIAMIKVFNKLKEKNLKSRLILQVHDELLIEVHKDEIEEVKQILKYEMEHAVSLDVPLDVDMHLGKTWFDTK
ncbi:DNA polymerase I [Defluviitalea raffinosedens]|uniref:DNA polymerase I n=1 Tax=Defluviitalea raffinosedens TaxID=1450156 RepID=A0A7C8HG07_9FIRM|nr:DNA polymerase I [Defluviitalea raffinosedens]KAE9636898.1 DNA polymerase I [Defluviitalea raffinosedens]